MTVVEALVLYEQEAAVMMRCADKNPRETGGSYYATRGVFCAQVVDALRAVLKEYPNTPRL